MPRADAAGALCCHKRASREPSSLTDVLDLAYRHAYPTLSRLESHRDPSSQQQPQQQVLPVQALGRLSRRCALLSADYVPRIIRQFQHSPILQLLTDKRRECGCFLLARDRNLLAPTSAAAQRESSSSAFYPMTAAPGERHTLLEVLEARVSQRRMSSLINSSQMAPYGTSFLLYSDSS